MVIYCERHTYLRQVYFLQIAALPHLFRINAFLNCSKMLSQMGYCAGGMLPNNYDRQTMDAKDKVHRTIILQELFFSAIKQAK